MLKVLLNILADKFFGRSFTAQDLRRKSKDRAKAKEPVASSVKDGRNSEISATIAKPDT
ncbi:hypothetical protein KAU93_03705 [Candidatus Bathyarchaeota archaeon]|nr:hypothetical protein [Candidatus Bathyarchaeota archaeon]